MRVTGVITCHNYADMVKDAVGSFVAQDYEQKRLIVFDDGSYDGSWDVIREVAKSPFPCPIEVLSSATRVGQAVAKNACMARSAIYTDAYAFLDADDVYMPGKLAKSVELLKIDYGQVGLVYTDECVMEKMSGRIRRVYKPAFSLERLAELDFIGGNFVVRKDVVDTIGGFDDSFRVAENYEFFTRVIEKYMILHIPEWLVTAGVTNRSLANRTNRDEWQYYNMLAVNKARQRYAQS